MTTTHTQNDPSSVPNFLEDDEDEGGVAMQAGTVQQPENSAEPQRQSVESETIGADRTPAIATIGADSQVEAVEFNPIVAGDQNEFDDDSDAEPSLETTTSLTGKEWKQRVAAGEVKGYEHPNKGKNPDSPTKKKRKDGSIYNRRALSEKDYLVLGFLSLFEFITTKQVSIIREVSVPSARRLMLGLQEFGVVAQENYDYGQQLWYLTGRGLSYAKAILPLPETVQPLHRSGHFDLSKIRPNLAASHVAAQLMAGTDTIRHLLDIDLSIGIDLLKFLVPERFIRSSFNSAMQDAGHKGGFKGGKAQLDTCMTLWGEIRTDLEAGRQEHSEVMADHPMLWTVVANEAFANGPTKKFHPADLVLNFSASRTDMLAGSVAIEIELTIKTDEELLKIIRSYYHAQSPDPYAMVIYITNQPEIARRVKALAQAYYDDRYQKTVPKAERKKQTLFKVVEFKDAEGNLFSGRVWEL